MNIKQTIYIVFFIANLFATTIRAENKLMVRKYSSNEGLAQNSVSCILEDSKGFMWFGTQEGLNKFNGYKFEHFNHNANDSNTLAINKNIRSLAEDKQGNIWIGTIGSGINIYNPITNKITRNEKIRGLGELQSEEIISMAYDKKNDIMWICGEANIYEYNLKSKKLFNRNKELLQSKGGKYTLVKLTITKNFLFILSSTGFFFKQHNINSWGYKEPTSERKEPLKLGGFYANDSAIFLGTNAGFLIRYDVKQNYLSNHQVMEFNKSNPLTPATELLAINGISARGQKLYISTKSGGLYTYEAIESPYVEPVEIVDEKNTKESIRDLLCTYVSNNEAVWIGSANNGVLMNYKNFKKFRSFEFLKGISVFGITEDNVGNIWFATDQRGLFKYNKSTLQATNYKYAPGSSIIPNNKDNSITSLYCNKNNFLYVGNSSYGLNIYDILKNKAVKLPVDNARLLAATSSDVTTVLSVLEDKQNNLWIATYEDGIYRVKNDNQLFHYSYGDGLPSNKIFQLFDNNNVVWAASQEQGVLKFNTKKGIFEGIDYINKKLNSKCVQAIVRYDRNTILLATEGGVVIVSEAEQTVKTFTTKDGLPSETIYGIIKDKNGFVWLSSLKGLTRFNPTSTSIDFANFSVDDGLQDAEFNQLSFYQCKDGLILFGGLNGVNYFYADDISIDKTPPRIYITDIKKNSKESFFSDSSTIFMKAIEFNAKQAAGVIRFEFLGINYKQPENNMYQYMLQGFDDNWSEPTKENFKEYTNLDGGSYIFKVKASNSDGVWNDKFASIEVTVNPPFYKTMWFMVTSVLLILISLFAYFQYRTDKVLSEKRILEKAVASRTKDLAEKNKDITSSIEYAKRIQDAILPNQKKLYEKHPNSFIYFKPKDIVSGDFYWYAVKHDCTIIAAVDCTGHGVPGAFMSMIGNNLLNKIVNENNETEPGRILDELNLNLRLTLKNGRYDAETTDGMDIAICKLYNKTKIAYAGAYRPLFYVKDGEMIKIEANKFPIGGSKYINDNKYQSHYLDLNEGDCVYLFSDGYGDQFGGEHGKKFTLRKLQNLLADIHTLPAQEQFVHVSDSLNNWKGNYEQVDDILMIGVKL